MIETNPIVGREMLGLLRRYATVAIFIALAAALSLVVLVMWPEGVATAGQARQVFRVFMYGLLVSLLLAVPAYPATAIVRERNAGTLALLLTSPLKPASIIVGKLSAALGFVALLLVLSLPASMACFVMGHIEVAHVLGAYLVLLLLACQLAMIGLVVSSYARTTDSALRITYGVVLALTVLTLIPYQMLQTYMAGPVGTIGRWLYTASPVPAIAKLVGDAGFASFGGRQDFDPIARYCLLAVITIAICGFWLTRRLRPRLLDRSRSTAKVTEERSTSERAFRRLMFLFDPQRRERLIGWSPLQLMISGAAFAAFTAVAVYLFRDVYAAMGGLEGEVAAPGSPADPMSFAEKFTRVLLACIPAMFAILAGFSFLFGLAGGHPVIVKEFRSRALGRSSWMMRLIGLCLIVSIGLTYLTASWSGTAVHVERADYLGGVLVVFQMALIVLITPALSAGLISVELESGGWQLMQTTRLAPRQIVFGKLISVATTVLLLLLATVPGYLVLLVVNQQYMPMVIEVLITLGLTALFTLLLGAACSSLFRKTAATTTTAYLVLLGLCVGTLVFWLGEGMLFGRSLVEPVLAANPVAAGLSAMKVPGFAQYQIVETNWKVLGIGSAVAAAALWLRVWWLSRPQ